MNFVSVLACSIVTFSVLSTIECRISFPQIYPVSTKSTTVATTKRMPEGRRQLPIFPKSLKKFTLSPMSYYKTHTTQSIMSVITKRPLMRKLVLQEKRYEVNKIIETRTTRRPLMKRNFKFAKRVGVFRQTTPQKAINELHFMDQNIGSDVRNINESANLKVESNHGERKQETTTVNSVASEKYTTQDNKFIVSSSIESKNSRDESSPVTTESTTLQDQNMSIENCVTTSEETTKESEMNVQEFTIKIKSDNFTNGNNVLQLETTTNFEIKETTTEKTNEIQTTTEVTTKDNTISEIANTYMISIQTTESNTANLITDEYIESTERYTLSEIADQNEFIFLNEAHTSYKIEHDNILPESDEYTTEIFIEPEIRKRRSVNVIEEENAASTVSSLKLTDKDMKISDSVYFRNINL